MKLKPGSGPFYTIRPGNWGLHEVL